MPEILVKIECGGEKCGECKSLGRYVGGECSIFNRVLEFIPGVNKRLPACLAAQRAAQASPEQITAEAYAERDRLWCVALLHDLNTEQIAKVTAYFNSTRAPHDLDIVKAQAAQAKQAMVSREEMREAGLMLFAHGVDGLATWLRAHGIQVDDAEVKGEQK